MPVEGAGEAAGFAASSFGPNRLLNEGVEVVGAEVLAPPRENAGFGASAVVAGVLEPPNAPNDGFAPPAAPAPPKVKAGLGTSWVAEVVAGVEVAGAPNVSLGAWLSLASAVLGEKRELVAGVDEAPSAGLAPVLPNRPVDGAEDVAAGFGLKSEPVEGAAAVLVSFVFAPNNPVVGAAGAVFPKRDFGAPAGWAAPPNTPEGCVGGGPAGVVEKERGDGLFAAGVVVPVPRLPKFMPETGPAPGVVGLFSASFPLSLLVLLPKEKPDDEPGLDMFAAPPPNRPPPVAGAGFEDVAAAPPPNKPPPAADAGVEDDAPPPKRPPPVAAAGVEDVAPPKLKPDPDVAGAPPKRGLFSVPEAGFWPNREGAGDAGEFPVLEPNRPPVGAAPAEPNREPDEAPEAGAPPKVNFGGSGMAIEMDVKAFASKGGGSCLS